MTHRGTGKADIVLPGAYLPDTGCELSPSCLGCTLPRCKYDDPGFAARRRRLSRARAIAEARAPGATVLELTARFGVSERTVYRIVKETQP
jgi:hypothetical protein